MFDALADAAGYKVTIGLTPVRIRVQLDIVNDSTTADVGDVNVAQQSGLADFRRQARVNRLIVAMTYLVSVTRDVLGVVSASGFLSLRVSAF